MDINSPDFFTSFDIKKATVGIVGQGFVGNAIRSFFERRVKCLAYDKYKSTGSSLEDVVKASEVIFVCVPTPMRESGECYTGIVQDVLNDIAKTAREIGRPGDTFVVCVKSTVPPGFTDQMKVSFPMLRLVFSPEFLTEKNSVGDMLNANRVIVGGEMDDTKIVLHFFLEADRKRIEQGKCVLMHCSSRSAEMAKLLGNGLLFSKVVFCNEVYALCQKMGIEYDEVRTLAALDPRIGASHTGVPGHDGFLGAGGHCFPKDLNNLKFLAQQHGVPERMFTAVLQRNGEIREEKDWEKMNDRAVTKR